MTNSTAASPSISVGTEFLASGKNRFRSLEHFQEYVRDKFINGSCIDPELFEACVEFHEDFEADYGGEWSAPIHENLGWEFKRFGYQANEPLYVAFLMNEDGSIWQGIVSLWDSEKERPYRYLAPKDIGDRAFLPPVPESIRKRIGDIFGVEVPQTGSFWEWFEDAPIPRIPTEGGKKSLCALSHGFVAISLYGSTCGAKDKDQLDNKIEPYLIPDLERFATPGSIWLDAMDEDTSNKAKKSVAIGKRKRSKALTANYCLVGDIRWNANHGKGMDDLFKNQGSEAFKQAYQNALESLEAVLNKDAKKSKQPPKPDFVGRWIGEKYDGKWAWDKEHKTWRIYEWRFKGVWEPAEDSTIEKAILQFLRAKGIEGYRSYAYITDIRKFLQLELEVERWLERSEVMPFLDGIFDLKTNKFEEHSPDNHLTWSLPRKYQTSCMEDWGTIRAWLHEATQGNTQDIRSLILFAAAVLRSRYDLHKFLYLIGDGGNGKGVYTRLLEDLVGKDNTWSGTIDSLSNDQHAARLFNKKLAIFPDQEKCTRIGAFKNITGEDKLSAKIVWHVPFDFLFKGLCIVTANSEVLLGTGDWLKRRAVAIFMNHKPKKRKNLQKLFEPELAAFTKYLLSIPEEEINQRFQEDEDTSTITNANFWDVSVHQDNVAAWIDEHVAFDDVNAFTSVGSDKDEWLNRTYSHKVSTLFGSYVNYCRKAGLTHKSLLNFRKQFVVICKLLDKPVEPYRNKFTRGFKGVRLRSPMEPTISEILRSEVTPYRGDTTDDSCGDTLESLQDKGGDGGDTLLPHYSHRENNLDSIQQELPITNELPPPEVSPKNQKAYTARDIEVSPEKIEDVTQTEVSPAHEVVTQTEVSPVHEVVTQAEASPAHEVVTQAEVSPAHEVVTQTEVSPQNEEVDLERLAALQTAVVENWNDELALGELLYSAGKAYRHALCEGYSSNQVNRLKLAHKAFKTAMSLGGN